MRDLHPENVIIVVGNDELKSPFSDNISLFKYILKQLFTLVLVANGGYLLSVATSTSVNSC